MRVMLLAAAAAGLACDPLYAPATASCGHGCPAACPDVCLSSGACREVRLGLGPGGFVALGEGMTLPLGLGDLPPNAEVRLHWEAALDLNEREGRLPYPYWFRFELDGATIVDVARLNATDWPVRVAWDGRARTDANGSLSLDLRATRCRGLVGGERCLFEPPTLLVATLAASDPAPAECVGK